MTKKIMIIDDEKDTVGLVKEILESEGYDTVAAYSGKEALDFLKNVEVKPDLLLLDIFMPGMGGREVCEKIRQESSLKDLKVAFFTAATAFRGNDKQMLDELKVSDYITKPFDTDDLVKRVHRLLAE